jgi:hypothetical protein
MRLDFKQKSIKLRRQGHSVKEISEALSVSMGSVSTWVRGVSLTPAQKLHLKHKTHSPAVIEKRRQSRLKNELSKKTIDIDASAKEIKKIDRNTLMMIGLGLYWGEGSKKGRGVVRISNSDPAIIMMAMRFFREICVIEEKRFRGHIHIHSEANVKGVEQYWSQIAKIPLSQFYKTYTVKSKSSKNIRHTLPFGTLDIGVCDTKLLLKILGWIEGLKKQL